VLAGHPSARQACIGFHLVGRRENIAREPKDRSRFLDSRGVG
jgi:hypothetical protein